MSPSRTSRSRGNGNWTTRWWSLRTGREPADRGIRGLELLAKAREHTGMAIVIEALNTELVPTVAEYAEIIQIGSRNMQNFALLRCAGGTGKPVPLTRGNLSTIRERLLSAKA
jgi:3-deoxy-7-phosphoheptulonate synthase